MSLRTVAERMADIGHRAADDELRPMRPDERIPRDALDELGRQVSRLSQEVSLFRGNIVNQVLWSGTGRIPASGQNFWTKQGFEVPFARVIIMAIGADLRIENQPPRDVGVTALEGPGMLWAPAAMGRLEFPLVGNIITIYGAANTFFDLALLASPLAEGSAPCRH